MSAKAMHLARVPDWPSISTIDDVFAVVVLEDAVSFHTGILRFHKETGPSINRHMRNRLK